MSSTPTLPSDQPTDNLAYRFPVSVKGVILRRGQVILLKKGRDEWELPGGKLEVGEEPRECLRREIAEELGLPVEVGAIVDSWVYRIGPGVDVLIVTYGCHAYPSAEIVHSDEHKALGLFGLDALDGLPLPGGYKASIRDWAAKSPSPDTGRGGRTDRWEGAR